MYVYACLSGFDVASGQCDGGAAYVEIPDPSATIFPPLTIEDGLLVSFSIVGIWTLGLAARIFIKAQKPQSTYGF